MVLKLFVLGMLMVLPGVSTAESNPCYEIAAWAENKLHESELRLEHRNALMTACMHDALSVGCAYERLYEAEAREKEIERIARLIESCRQWIERKK